MENPVVRVGCGLLIIKNSKLLLGKRINKKGFEDGKWAPPGGHVEMFEALKDTVIRETFEETGLAFKPRHIQNTPIFSEDFDKKKNWHYITFQFIVNYLGTQEPKIMEPEKCVEWKWFNKANFPKDNELFMTTLKFKKQILRLLNQEKTK